MKVNLSERSGRCRWCSCTERDPCLAGCGWANATATLCTECVPLDCAIKTAAGRQELAEFLQEHGFLNPKPPQGGRRASRS